MALTLQFKFILQWKDHRLNFTNLHNNSQYNRLPLSPGYDAPIWLPDIRVSEPPPVLGTKTGVANTQKDTCKHPLTELHKTCKYLRHMLVS